MTRYDFYFILTSILLIATLITLIILYRRKQSNFIAQSGQRNKTFIHEQLPTYAITNANQTKETFLGVTTSELQKAINANTNNKDFQYKQEFKHLKGFGDWSHAQEQTNIVNISIMNNTKAKPLTKSILEPKASDYLNSENATKNGARALLIGQNQCGKTHLATQFSHSLEGISVVVNVDANNFSGQSDNLYDIIENLYESIQEIKQKGKKVNFIIHIDEFDSKNEYPVDGFLLNLDSFKRRIFEGILESNSKPKWLIPHLLITANNEHRFLKTPSAGSTNAPYTLFSRIPDKFVFKEITKDKLPGKLDEFLAEQTNLKNKKDQIKNSMITKLESDNAKNTFNMRDITAAFNAVEK